MNNNRYSKQLMELYIYFAFGIYILLYILIYINGTFKHINNIVNLVLNKFGLRFGNVDH